MADKVLPVRPEEVGALKVGDIPDAVFEIVNQLLVERSGQQIIAIRQGEIMNCLDEKGLSRREIFEKRWLDIENSYREVGWIVTFETTNEGGDDSIFTFRRPAKN